MPGGERFGIFRIISEVPSERPEPLQSQARAAGVLWLPMSDCGFFLVCPQRVSAGNGVERDTPLVEWREDGGLFCESSLENMCYGAILRHYCK